MTQPSKMYASMADTIEAQYKAERRLVKQYERALLLLASEFGSDRNQQEAILENDKEWAEWRANAAAPVPPGYAKSSHCINWAEYPNA